MPARPGRVANDWLPYIRPHLRPYEALGRGDRGDYIAKLSKKVKLSDNTLRRFIAAAQFLEAEGITELRPDTRMPVAAVERIARIAARQPERRRKLLEEVAEARLTIMQLRDLLQEKPQGSQREKPAQVLPRSKRASYGSWRFGGSASEATWWCDTPMTTSTAGCSLRQSNPALLFTFPRCVAC